VSRAFLNGRVTLHAGDCLAVLPTLAENSVDSVVTDPPYHLASIVKRFGADGAAPAKSNGATGVYGRASAGFMGKQWDGGDIAFRPETWAAVLRVLKPGGHMVAFAAPKNAHRMICAIEDAGFEIRDTLMWLFGSGFPKSLDVSKAIDKAAGVEREILGRRSDGRYATPMAVSGRSAGIMGDVVERLAPAITAPATDAARAWEGFGTSLKPAYEPVVLARKPLSEGTIAANVLKHGTGALNIGACRISASGRPHREVHARRDDVVYGGNSLAGRVDGTLQSSKAVGVIDLGRWPANVIHDGSDEVVAGFPETTSGSLSGQQNDNRVNGKRDGWGLGGWNGDTKYEGNSGSAARFFYTAKADADDRAGSKHPTVKPLDLMHYLVRLVTPPRGVILDPFAGTGTTGEAAWREGFSAILIEREPEYLADIERRMALALAGPDERARESIKARLKDKPVDAGPLFDGAAA
jgi:DNA modification methylase